MFLLVLVTNYCLCILVESNQKSSIQEIPRLSEDLLSKQKYLEKIETGDKGLNKIWVNITEISKQVN